MSHLHESNRYISDVPMFFSDRFLSRIVDESSLMKYDQIEDMNRFHVDDYKFDAELFAIETFEMHTKALEETKKKLEKENEKAVKVEEKPSENTLLQQMLSSGGILTPEPVQHNFNNSETSDSHSKQNCDQNSVQNGGKAIRPINPNDFDNNDSSPFDTLELKTINEREELNKLFRTMNVQPAVTVPMSTVPLSSLSAVSVNASLAATPTLTANPPVTITTASTKPTQPPATTVFSTIQSTTMSPSNPFYSMPVSSISQIHTTTPSNAQQPQQQHQQYYNLNYNQANPHYPVYNYGHQAPLQPTQLPQQQTAPYPNYGYTPATYYHPSNPFYSNVTQQNHGSVPPPQQQQP